jgi:hypothetical protein
MRMLGTFVGGSAWLDPRDGGKRSHSLDVVDLDHDALRSIALDFMPHGMTVKPGAPTLAVIFEKRGPGAALVDLGTMTSRGKIKAKADRHYYGHGAYSREGDQLLSVETDLASGRGVISVRETTSYKEVETFPSYGDHPHDCMPIDDGKVLVISNGGGPLESTIKGSEPSVVYIDVASRKLLEKVTFTDPKVNAGHIAIAKDGSLAVVSAPRDGLPKETSAGGIHLRTGKRKPERMRGPDAVMAKVVGESLSVAIHRDVVAVTNPMGGVVTFWSFAKKKMLHSLELPNPRAVEVTRDEKHFVIGYGPDATLLLVDVETLQPLERKFGTRRISGSHMFPFFPAPA